MYKNYEGFSDPTAGLAMSHVLKEYREERRRTWRRETEIKERPKVYMASKYAGDIEKNRRDTIRYCRAAKKTGISPLPHIFSILRSLMTRIPVKESLDFSLDRRFLPAAMRSGSSVTRIRTKKLRCLMA